MEYLGNGYNEQFNQWYAEAMKVIKPEANITDNSVFNVSIVVTKACNFACTYCYMHGKRQERMSRGTAKKAVDLLLSDKINGYIDPDKTPCVILDFIGGEPLLEIDLIDYFIDYFVYEAHRLNHRWANEYSVSMSSNGSLYHTPKVQEAVRKYHGRFNIAITIDGTKELHDACRKYPDGRGTYDDVEKNVKLYLQQGGHPSTKMTIAPENLDYLCEASLHLFGLGYKWLYCNVQFEDVWNPANATRLYYQLKKLADCMIDGELYKNHYNSMFDETIGIPLGDEDNTNWCGGDGKMLAIGPDGRLYPCLRYMDYCFSTPGREPLCIGNVDDGININDPRIAELKCITRRSQSTDECFYCPVAKGCNWCSAYNYDIYGTANKRTTFHCIMQKARVLANVYYWNKLYRKLGMTKRFPHHMPDEWALQIIEPQEIELLKEISKEG